MKFSDLKFRSHPILPDMSQQAVVYFPNGWFASVVNGGLTSFMTEKTGEYEIGIRAPDGEMYDNDDDEELGHGPYQGDEAEIERILSLIEARGEEA